MSGSSSSCNAVEQDNVGVPRDPLWPASNCPWNVENYDKNSRPDSFYPHSAPIKSRKLQAEFTGHSGM